MLHDDLQHTSTLREDTIFDRAHGVSNLDDLLGVGTGQSFLDLGGEFCGKQVGDDKETPTDDLADCRAAFSKFFHI